MKEAYSLSGDDDNGGTITQETMRKL